MATTPAVSGKEEVVKKFREFIASPYIPDPVKAALSEALVFLEAEPPAVIAGMTEGEKVMVGSALLGLKQVCNQLLSLIGLEAPSAAPSPTLPETSKKVTKGRKKNAAKTEVETPEENPSPGKPGKRRMTANLVLYAPRHDSEEIRFFDALRLDLLEAEVRLAKEEITKEEFDTRVVKAMDAIQASPYKMESYEHQRRSLIGNIHGKYRQGLLARVYLRADLKDRSALLTRLAEQEKLTEAALLMRLRRTDTFKKAVPRDKAKA